ncbi:hypothetical protein V865_007613 [Kwoniella europaea PYCC6329]|uniref:GATA-type domain-containing protein n=1 Tax=Kwoniella europaea PYCC6329 TaxID=1423913 RepID=A0AAX4KU86_9TREE
MTTKNMNNTHHIPNQSISSQTDRSNSPILVSPTSPPLVALSPSHSHSHPHSIPVPVQGKKSQKSAKNKTNTKSRKSHSRKSSSSSTVNSGTRFPPYSTGGERQCTNCSEVDTPQWRGTLCNACALWKRSRGTDRPLPLLFPVKRRSPTPEEEEEDDRSEDGGIDHSESSPTIVGVNVQRRFWVDERKDRSTSENPLGGQLPVKGRDRSETLVRPRPRLGMGIVRGCPPGRGVVHGHGRTMSYQPVINHQRQSSHPFPTLNLSIIPPDSTTNVPQTGRIQGVHSTPVSPTHPHDDGLPFSNNNNGQQAGLGVGLQSPIAALMSQVRPEDKHKRRNSIPSIGVGFRSISLPGNRSGSHQEMEEVRSPYLPYSLDKKGPHQSRLKAILSHMEKQQFTAEQNELENENENESILGLGVSKDEFMRNAGWLYDVLERSGRLLFQGRTQSQGQGVITLSEDQMDLDDSDRDDSSSSSSRTHVEEEDYGGLDILGELAEEELESQRKIEDKILV